MRKPNPCSTQRVSDAISHSVTDLCRRIALLSERLGPHPARCLGLNLDEPADVAYFQECFGQSGLSAPCPLGDFEGDDNIGTGDFTWFAVFMAGPQ